MAPPQTAPTAFVLGQPEGDAWWMPQPLAQHACVEVGGLYTSVLLEMDRSL